MFWKTVESNSHHANTWHMWFIDYELSPIGKTRELHELNAL